MSVCLELYLAALRAQTGQRHAKSDCICYPSFYLFQDSVEPGHSASVDHSAGFVSFSEAM
jgi:hypothetical protein